MPWCETCAKFWNPNSLTAVGECPTCGHRFTRSVDTETARRTADPAAGDADATDDYKAPWHFKLMVAMAVVYVSWRIIQVVTWIV
jgi:predicted RNA-binding Zn-ribbon protein involved in translation (DUF1610 family)